VSDKSCNHHEQVKALEISKRAFGDQIQIMQSQANSLQAQLDFHRKRADEMRD
jgi:peptidoglycan hydrolase CwlO-like protein